MRVTEILGFFNPNKDFYKEGSADRGSALHELALYYQLGTLKKKAIPGELILSFSWWEKYYLENIWNKKDFLPPETQIDGKHFSGHPDKTTIEDSTVTIYDWKFGQFQGSHLVQVGGFYSLLVKEYYFKKYNKTCKTQAVILYGNDSSACPVIMRGLQIQRAEACAKITYEHYVLLKSNYKGIL